MENSYEQGKVKEHLGHGNFQIIGTYNGWTGDGNRATFVSVKVNFEIVQITIDNVTGETWET